jgi:2'-5' RNA ligase
MQAHCLFIATHLPDHIASILEQRQHSLRHHLGDSQNALCWTPKSQFHLTLAFLGKVESTFLPRIIEELEIASKVLSPQLLQLGKCGLFCRRGIPTVLWSEVQADQQLCDWCQKLREKLRPHCPNLGDKEFHPHLTLGRIKSGRSIDRCALKHLFEQDDLCANQQSWTCDKVTLMQSEHCAKGATHSVLHTCNLGNSN